MRARLCMKPSRRELAHARVDHRVAGPAFLPRVERSGSSVPFVATRPVVGPRGVGPRREDLLVEVAPAELAHERLVAREPVDGVHDLQGDTQPKCR